MAPSIDFVLEEFETDYQLLKPVRSEYKDERHQRGWWWVSF